MAQLKEQYQLLPETTLKYKLASPDSSREAVFLGLMIMCEIQSWEIKAIMDSLIPKIRMLMQVFLCLWCYYQKFNKDFVRSSIVVFKTRAEIKYAQNFIKKFYHGKPLSTNDSLLEYPD